MKNKDILYSCQNSIVHVQLPDHENSTEVTFWLERFCPGVTVSDKYRGGSKYKVICKTSSVNKYEVIGNRTILLYSTWDYNYGPFLAKLITQIFQYLLNLQNMYIIPGVVISKSGKSILFVGDYWQGKTSVALNTHKINSRIGIVSDNYVLTKNNKILSGTKYISIRKENIGRFRDILISESIKTVNSRSYFQLKSSKIPGEIVAFITPHINENDRNLHIVSKEESTWYLYQKLSGVIKGDTLMFNGQTPAPGFDNRRLASNRLKYVNKLLEKSKLHYVSSGIDTISDYALGLFQK